MDMRNKIRGGLAGLVLGGALYSSQAHAETLMVPVGNLYLTCDTDETYAANNVCYAPVNAYNAGLATKKSSSSSSGGHESQQRYTTRERRLELALERRIEEAAKRKHRRCPDC